MDGVTVTFDTLFRGNFGTEGWIGEHADGEACYLYTTDTFQTMAVNPNFTKRKNVSKMFFGGTMFAGIPEVVWGEYADAGSARPWAPTSTHFDATTSTLDWLRRRSFLVDFMKDPGVNGMNLTDDWGNHYLVWETDHLPSQQGFEQTFIRTYDPESLEGGTIRSQLLGTDLAPGVAIETDAFGKRSAEGALSVDPTTDTVFFVLVQVNNRNQYEQDAAGGVVGYPAMRAYVPSGAEGGGGAPPECAENGAGAGTFDGELDFGGPCPGPNYQNSIGNDPWPLPFFTAECILAYAEAYDNAYAAACAGP
jgi:hypothetical protein